MFTPKNPHSTWGPSVHPSRLPDEDWQATREMVSAPTQVMRSQDEYLAPESREIGRRVGDQQHELFVVCDPAEALLQQFLHVKPDFIALHDVATDASRRLLAGLAAATRSKVQQLVIRRQGYGMALATLEFAELPGSNGQKLRVYSTHVDADMQQRALLARALLAHSRLGVVMLGDLPPHAMNSALQPLREGIVHGPWPNRHLLMVPLGSASAAPALIAPLADPDRLGVRTTPHAASPSQAWTFISTAWNRLRAGLPADVDTAAAGPRSRAAAPAGFAHSAQAPFQNSSQAPFQNSAHAPLPMQPMPPTNVKPVAALTPWERYVREASDIRGMVSCAVFEVATQRSLAHAGARPGPASLTAQGALMLNAMTEAARALGVGNGIPEAVVTLHGHLLLLHPIAGHPGLVLHAVLDRHAANLAQAKVQLHKMDAVLDVAARPAA